MLSRRRTPVRGYQFTMCIDKGRQVRVLLLGGRRGGGRVHCLLFAPTSLYNTPIPPYFFPFHPDFSPLYLFPTHFSPIFPVLGTLRARCSLYYHLRRLGIFKAPKRNNEEVQETAHSRARS